MFSKDLQRDILLVLAAKAFVLALIWAAFFAPTAPSKPDRASTLSHLVGDQSR
jgi:hypothetical protein